MSAKLKPKSVTTPQCSFGCDAPARTHGVCGACYQWFRHKNLMMVDEPIAYNRKMDRIERRRSGIRKPKDARLRLLRVVK